MTWSELVDALRDRLALTGDEEGCAETRNWMSGKLCRCAAYPRIVAAVSKAAVR